MFACPYRLPFGLPLRLALSRVLRTQHCGVSVLNIAGSPYSTLRSVAYGAHGLGGYDLRGSICVVRFAYPKPLCGSAVRTDF